MLTRRLLLPLLLLPVSALGRTAAPKDAYLYIIWPNDGERIKGAFWCRFGLRGMGVTHAGDNTANLGHHHLLVDVDIKDMNMDEPIPQDRKHLHFGTGQTEARLDLAPGTHTLQLVLGDADHIPFDPPVVSKQIKVIIT